MTSNGYLHFLRNLRCTLALTGKGDEKRDSKSISKAIKEVIQIRGSVSLSVLGGIAAPALMSLCDYKCSDIFAYILTGSGVNVSLSLDAAISLHILTGSATFSLSACV